MALCGFVAAHAASALRRAGGGRLAAMLLWEYLAVPGGLARSLRLDGHPGLDACDPGDARDMQLTGRAERALALPSLWAYLVADAAAALDADGARCYARAAIDQLTYDEITDPDGALYRSDRFSNVLRSALERCR